MCDFVHLHVHSEYSLLDGAARIEQLAAQAAKLKMPALALTDHGGMYGAIPFYKACLANGIKPIIGMEAYLTTGSRFEKKSLKEQPICHLTLLAKNQEGYRNLMKLSSIAHLEGFYYKPRIDFQVLSAHAKGIICLSGCLGSEVNRLLQAEDYEAAKETITRYRQIFGTDYYLEIQDHALFAQKKILNNLMRLSTELNVPLVATNDVHYLEEEDHRLQDILLCIGTGKTIHDKDRFRMQTSELYFKTGVQMTKLFLHVPEAISNTKKIADQCFLDLTFGEQVLPAYPMLPEGVSSSEYLQNLCHAGLLVRYEKLAQWSEQEFRQRAYDRLTYELQIIAQMGFNDYFLVVWDFMHYAHEQGIVTGPGRGSAAGSLVSYALQITDVDPLKYNLLFERFLNPQRVNMPDIDIDFSDLRRDEIIHYVSNKYGAEHVAQIVTFGTLGARSAVRDVGRVLNIPYGVVDRVAKLIPVQLGMTIDRALEQKQPLQDLVDAKKTEHLLIETARKVEGFPRHTSTHAAGIVISAAPLTDFVPLQSGSGHLPITQYAMENVETVGLLKMDFLGLRTLSIIEKSLQQIKEQTGKEVDWQHISQEDPATYELISQGITTGVFQLESSGMRHVLQEMQPSSFEDIISVVALYRPGPMEFIPQFIRAKQGLAEITYPHANLEPILRETYGIIVYQEQIMQIASVMAGFTLAEADLLRRAVGKKKKHVLIKQRENFVTGSVRQGYSEIKANEVYDLIVRFANYGFCRAHAASYAVIAFQTAYLKCHFPLIFMASMLSAVTGNLDKTAEYVEECRRMGIVLRKPDIKESGLRFTAVEGAIRFGLTSIKNVGSQAIESILRARNEKPFSDLSDFCRRVDSRTCNKRVIESLVLCGALDSLPGHRAQKLAAIEQELALASRWRKEREELQIAEFDFIEKTSWDAVMPDVPEFTPMQILEQERDLMGLYLSGHPLDAYEEVFQTFQPNSLSEIAEMKDRSFFCTMVRVVNLKTIVTRKGEAMAFIEIEDRVKQAEGVLFPKIWDLNANWIEKGTLCMLFGRLQTEDNGIKLLIDQIYALDNPDHLSQIHAYYGRTFDSRNRQSDATQLNDSSLCLFIMIDAEHEQLEILTQLKTSLGKFKGMTPTILHYVQGDRTIALSEDYKVNPCRELISKLENLLGEGKIKVKKGRKNTG